VITSRQNQHVKLFRALAERKLRQREGKFVLDGVLQVAEAREAGWAFDEVFVCPELLRAKGGRALLGELPTEVPHWEVSEHVFRALTDRAEPEGIAAIVLLPSRALADLGIGEQALVVAVEAIRDPGNLGTIIRTCHAAAADALVTLGDSVDAFGPKAVRAAMGSVFHVPVVEAHVAGFRRWAHAEGLRVLAAAAEGGRPFHEVTFPARAALLLGNEAHGLSAEALACADERIAIPMPGGTESLNAAVAAGILIYEALRQTGRLTAKGHDGEE
jgi:TrmH family RNA methyltransferase